MNTWILLRGLARETRHWGRFQAQWLEVFPETRLVAIDLPGTGELNTATCPMSIGETALQCRREAARMGISPPYNLLAMSMGAMVAAAWAQNHPREVKACVLINTSFGSFSPLHHRMRPRAWLTLLRFLLTPSAAGREQIVLHLTSSLGEPAENLIQDWVAIRKSRPVRIGNALRQLIAAARFNAPSAAPARTLLLASSGDRLVNPNCSADIARRWNCTIAMHPSAGHDLPLDDGPWIAEQVQDWLTVGGSDLDGP